MKKYILTESQIRNLVSGFVDEAKGDTKYTPEYLEKIREKYKGRPLSDFRDGKDSGAWTYVFNKDKGYYLDFTKDMIRSQRLGYTKDEIIDIAKNFKTRNEFRVKGKGASRAASNFGPFITNPITGKIKNTFGFYNSITSHMDVINNSSKRLVYAHEFYDENGKPIAVYVGLTYNSEKRKEQHIKGINVYGNEKLSPVTKFTREHPTYIHKYKELTKYIDESEAVKMEKHVELKYFKEGWDILNVKPTGGLGGTRKKNLKQLKKEVDYIHDVEGVTTLKDFMEKYKRLYKTIVYWGLHDPNKENYLLGKFIKRVKTNDELMSMVKKHNSYFDFYNDQKLYSVIQNRELLPKVREYFNKSERNSYSNEDIISKALEYDNYTDIWRNKKLYDIARYRKLLPKIKELFVQKEQEQQNEPVE